MPFNSWTTARFHPPAVASMGITGSGLLAAKSLAGNYRCPTASIKTQPPWCRPVWKFVGVVEPHGDIYGHLAGLQSNHLSTFERRQYAFVFCGQQWNQLRFGSRSYNLTPPIDWVPADYEFRRCSCIADLHLNLQTRPRTISGGSAWCRNRGYPRSANERAAFCLHTIIPTIPYDPASPYPGAAYS